MLIKNPIARRLASQSSIAMLIKIGNGGLSLLMNVLTARLLSSHDFGVYAILFSFLMGFTFCGTFGFHVSVMRFYPKIEKDFGEQAAHYFLRRTYKKLMDYWKIGLVVLSILCGIYSVIDYKIHGDMATDFMVYPYLIVLGFSLAASEFFSAALRLKDKNLSGVAARDIGWRGLVCVFLYIWIYFKLPINLPMMFLVMAVIMFAMSYIQYRIFVKFTPIDTGYYIEGYYDKAEMKQSLIYSWVNLLSQTIMLQSSAVLIGWFLSAKQAGIYFAADRFSFIMSLINISLTLIATPTLSKAFHHKDYKSLKKLYIFLCGIGICLTLPLLTLLYIYGEWLLIKFYGHSFASGYNVLLLLSFAWFLSTALGPITTLSQAVGLEKNVFWISFTISSLTLISSFFIVPVYGMTGAAMVVTVSLCLQKIILLAVNYKKIFLSI